MLPAKAPEPKGQDQRIQDVTVRANGSKRHRLDLTGEISPTECPRGYIVAIDAAIDAAIDVA
ncbi:hypothetical protein PROH_07670 [Prochlorothrix hollandica PCC 9006 = CALU 1027]|uniref:Uncharacterized protein n=1 Tax=Prochlorothrix hollandica PCC 9006 = CALU 1027 TaxID=317619 RepID=A0A0M2PT81_PROHO|nr:hypothetical protein PROH_07670 [Prochlorothrix hollandica PCC 9006 = CALU 1027]